MAINYKRILFRGLALSVILGGIVAVFVRNTNRQESTASPSDTVAAMPSGIYRDALVGYSIQIPSGYRLASHYMRFMSSLKDSGGYAPSAYDVVLTSATEADEQGFVEKLRHTYNSLDKDSEEYLIFPGAAHYLEDPGLSASIVITPTAGSYSDILRNVPRNHNVMDYEEVMLSNQQKVLRLSYGRLGGEMDQVVIPYNSKAKLPSGYKIQVIIIEMLRGSDAHNQRVFNTVLNSFVYQ